MKHTKLIAGLVLSLSALMVLPVQGQTSIVDSTGINPWQGSVELKAGRIDPSLLPPSGGGATLLRGPGVCNDFTNNSATVPIMVVAAGNIGLNGGASYLYVNGVSMRQGFIVDDGATAPITVVVPPLGTFSTNYSSCSFTALANSVTAAGIGFRYITGSFLVQTIPAYSTPCNGFDSGYLFVDTQYVYAYTYNLAPFTAGGYTTGGGTFGCTAG